jgi:hypothetical protein
MTDWYMERLFHCSAVAAYTVERADKYSENRTNDASIFGGLQI